MFLPRWFTRSASQKGAAYAPSVSKLAALPKRRLNEAFVIVPSVAGRPWDTAAMPLAGAAYTGTQVGSLPEPWRLSDTMGARRLVVPVAVIAALLLFYLVNPWFAPAKDSTLSTIVTVLFWIFALAVIVLMYLDSRDPETPQVEVESPRFARRRSAP